MSSYPPAGDYDERLLDNAPKASKLDKQEGYNVNLLASDDSETPMNTRPPPATVEGHISPENGDPSSKEGYTSPYSVPWYRQKKWRIFMLIGAIIVVGAVVGGAVGGVLASNNKKHNNTATGPSTVTLSSTVSSFVDAPAQSTSADGAPPPGSSPPVSGVTSGAGAQPTGNTGPSPTRTPSVNTNDLNGLGGSNPEVAPVARRFN